MPQVKPDTLIVTVHPEDDYYEMNTFDELRAIHNGSLPPAASPIYDPGFENWRAGAQKYAEWAASPIGEVIPSSYLARVAITGQVTSPMDSFVPTLMRV